MLFSYRFLLPCYAATGTAGADPLTAVRTAGVVRIPAINRLAAGGAGIAVKGETAVTAIAHQFLSRLGSNINRFAD